MPSDLPKLLSRVVNSRKAADYLDRLLQTHIDRIEAEAQRKVTEREFKARVGNRAKSYAEEKAKCAKDVLYWFDNWAWTFDPRLIAENKTPYIRFKLWPEQRKFILWLHDKVSKGEPWLLEKSRDQGATYLICAYVTWRWLFTPGFKATFCSRDELNVDSKGNPDSIFEKLRVIYRRLPPWMLPDGFNERKHDNIMQFTNPVTGAVVTGETGENPGRGGRSTMYVVDEAAFLAHPQKVEAAISGNTDCIGWVSTPNPESGGLANFFARKRAALANIIGSIFRLHYSADPRKTPEWAAKKKASMSDPSTWDAEYEISYTAATEGMAIPGKWVQSAVDLAKQFGVMFTPSKVGITGGDVGAGKAKSVCVHRFGPICLPIQRRQEADTTDTAYWMLDCMKEAGTQFLNFDVPGVGAGVLSTLTKVDRTQYPKIKAVYPINTGVPPSNRVWPDGTTSVEKFGNLKAEIWWLARAAIQRSHLHYLWLTKQEGGIEQKLEECALLPDDGTLMMQLSTPKWFRNNTGKIVIETKQQLAARRVPSPDDADGYVLSHLEPQVDPGTGLNLGINKEFQQENPFVVTAR